MWYEPSTQRKKRQPLEEKKKKENYTPKRDPYVRLILLIAFATSGL